MGFLKNYLAPGKTSKNAEPALVGTEMSVPQSVAQSGMSTAKSGTPWTSRPASFDMEIEEGKWDVLALWLYQEQHRRFWNGGSPDEGVVIKRGPGNYTCCPPQLGDLQDGFAMAVQQLNVKCAITVSTPLITMFLSKNTSNFVRLDNGLRLQVIPDMSYLPHCQKHHFAAFIADRGSLVVWDDLPNNLLSRVEMLDQALMRRVWNAVDNGEENEKKDMAHASVVELGSEGGDLEMAVVEPPRQINLIQPINVGLMLILVMVTIIGSWRLIAVEAAYDQSYLRFALIVVIPLQIWVSLFFFQVIIGNLAQLLGPVSQVHENSKYYSGKKPIRISARANGGLPHVTIQCPVYKEGLGAVIAPTIRSIKQAISTYEMQGGTANIFINDDGMQLIPEEEARMRQDFYDENNIGWVARPRHDPKGQHGEAFVRAGKFKKASNMNYAMWVSSRIEDKLVTINRPTTWTQSDEASAYQEALLEVVHEDQGRTWADGNIRMGDYILIIDSDTRVPEDCLLDAVSEMEHSPERGITFFTYLIYSAIKYGVSSGDVAPFVGHNAILRWSAIQSIVYDCPIDNREKWWSEETVSEDFDMALRLQNDGYIVRFAAYQGDGFQEGVSLTVYDELARWEKYAYGCAELVFHPFVKWPTRSPFTPLIRKFWSSGMPLPSKITIMSYIGTYYALGAAWILTLANYFLTGLYNPLLDKYYLDSFKVFLSLIVVFSALGNLSLAVLRYRIGEKGLIASMIENFSWLPLFIIFLGGVSLHISQALLSYFFCIDMSWGATAKEVDDASFFEEVPKIIKKFKYTLIYCIAVIILMIVCATALPPLWRIDQFISIFPLAFNIACHFCLPLLLNPSLMRFTF
ncbi:hypothetical protein MBLNU457_7239t1 [Dothideomycetes sp. NU457]